MEWVRRLLNAKVGRKQSVSVQVVSEHRTAEDYWVTQGSTDHVFYDVWLRIVVKPGPQAGYVIWVLRRDPRPASGHQGIALTWRGCMNGVELPPVVREELEGIGLHEVVARVARLADFVYADDLKPS